MRLGKHYALPPPRGINPRSHLASSSHISAVLYSPGQVCVPVNATKPDGATALFLAAQEGYADLALMLLEAGADIDLPDEDGISPLYIACYQVGLVFLIPVDLVQTRFSLTRGPFEVAGASERRRHPSQSRGGSQ